MLLLQQHWLTACAAMDIRTRGLEVSHWPSVRIFHVRNLPISPQQMSAFSGPQIARWRSASPQVRILPIPYGDSNLSDSADLMSIRSRKTISGMPSHVGPTRTAHLCSAPHNLRLTTCGFFNQTITALINCSVLQLTDFTSAISSHDIYNNAFAGWFYFATLFTYKSVHRIIISTAGYRVDYQPVTLSSWLVTLHTYVKSVSRQPLQISYRPITFVVGLGLGLGIGAY